MACGYANGNVSCYLFYDFQWGVSEISKTHIDNFINYLKDYLAIYDEKGELGKLDKKYDKYAFNWYAGKHELKAQYKDPATGEYATHGVPVEDTAQILSDIVKIENRRLKMWKKPFTMLFQFNDGTI